MYKPNKLKYKEKVLSHKVYVKFFDDEDKLVKEPFDNGEQAKRFVEANDLDMCVISEFKWSCFKKIKEDK